MFHKITPKTPGLSHLYLGYAGAVEFSPPSPNRSSANMQIAALRVSANPAIPVPVSGNVYGLWVDAAPNSWAGLFRGWSGITNQSWGVNIQAGTSAVDQALGIQSRAGTTLMNVYGDGGVVVGAPTGVSKGLGTVNIQNGLYINGVSIYQTGPKNIVFNGTNETRASQTTPSNATNFSGNALVAGTYIIEGVVNIKQAAAGSVGANVNFNYTAAFTNQYGYFGDGNQASANVATIFAGTDTVQSAVGNTSYSVLALNTFGDGVFFRIIFSPTASGTLNFAFAQNTSSATVITLFGGWMTITKIA